MKRERGGLRPPARQREREREKQSDSQSQRGRQREDEREKERKKQRESEVIRAVCGKATSQLQKDVLHKAGVKDRAEWCTQHSLMWLYGVGHLVKNQSDSKRGNLLQVMLHELLFPTRSGQVRSECLMYTFRTSCYRTQLVIGTGAGLRLVPLSGTGCPNNSKISFICTIPQAG